MLDKITVGAKTIGVNQPTFIIAEAGSNADGKIEQAKKLIDVASEAGVDAVKFQLFKADKLYDQDHPAFDIVKSCEFPREWFGELNEYASQKGLIFLASPFDEEAVTLMNDNKILAYKVASSETTNLTLLRQIGQKKKPVFLSTAMCDLADVYEAVEVLRSCGADDVVLLQCSAAYPTAPEDVNLRVMDTLRQALHLPVGFSDHSLGILMPPVAVARGACVIEKHFTLDRSLPGPDHSYAIEPDELKLMVEHIRAVENSLGSPVKKMLEQVKPHARRESLFFNRDLNQGDVVTEACLSVKRPATGLASRYKKAVLGAKVSKAVKKNEALTWESIE